MGRSTQESRFMLRSANPVIVVSGKSKSRFCETVFFSSVEYFNTPASPTKFPELVIAQPARTQRAKKAQALAIRKKKPPLANIGQLQRCRCVSNEEDFHCYFLMISVK